MEEVALKDLDPRIIKQVEDAKKGIDRNPSHSVNVLEGIVQRNPGCLDARRVLRQAQNRAATGKNTGLNKFLTPLSNIGLSLGNAKKIEKDPKAVMVAAEKAISNDPENAAAHRLLGKAALQLGMKETAIFAFGEFRKINPKDIPNVLILMETMIDVGRTEEAIKVGDSALRANPSDDQIPNLIRKASVQQSIQKGKWDEDKDFRSKLKDEDEAVKLEQQSRARTDEEGMRDLVKQALKRIEAEPANLNHYREAATNYRKLGEFDAAIDIVSKARQTESGKADTTLERLTMQIQREKMHAGIAAKEAELEANPEDTSIQEELKKLKSEERNFRLEQAQNLVQRYPNEFGYRYELGELYFEDGKIDDSIREFQLAQRNPKVRVNALIYLGKAYKAKEFYDLAAEQLENAKQEIPTVNEQKKDVVYELGGCYEAQGDMDKAMVEYKLLYGMDIAYRDVAQKIDEFYKAKRG